MHILGIQTLVVKLYFKHILDIQNISIKTLRYEYSRYSKH